MCDFNAWPVNCPVIRLEDILLMYAEIQVTKNNISKAINIVNRIRIRAGCDPVTTSDPNDSNGYQTRLIHPESGLLNKLPVLDTGSHLRDIQQEIIQNIGSLIEIPGSTLIFPRLNFLFGAWLIARIEPEKLPKQSLENQEEVPGEIRYRAWKTGMRCLENQQNEAWKNTRIEPG